MAKKTLLEIVQIIMSKLDTEEVNSIGDTAESLQVAMEVETSYHELVNALKIPERNELIQFEALQDPVNRPNYLRTKDTVDNFKFFMYNNGTSTEPNYVEVKYVEPEYFLRYLVNQSQASASMVVQDFSGVFFPISTDKHPTCYTMFDDEHLVFNSYNASVDDTLQESKSMAIGQVVENFQLTDDYVPDLPAKYFPWLIAEAASMCFINQKQSPNSKEEQRSRRQAVRLQNNRRRNSNQDNGDPDYGR